MHCHNAGVVELANAFRAKHLSPVELLDSLLREHDRLNPSINAFVALDIDGAFRAARQSERRLLHGKTNGLLDGIPVSVKDNLFVRGSRATWGSAAFKDHVALDDELPVARLRGRGAIIFGKTNVPEFTLQGYTCNRLFGATRNPWSLALTPGGSSGGAVAAVASGIGPLAMATDGGGSTRRPAGYTNLVGLKPSIGRIPRDGGFPQILYDLEVIGLIGRSVADVRIFYEELHGPHPNDRRSWYAKPGRRYAPSRTGRIIRLHKRFADSPVDPRIVQATQQAAARLEQVGARIEDTEPSFSVWEMAALLEMVFATGLAQLWECTPAAQSLNDSLCALLERGREISGAQYAAAITRISQLRNHADQIFGEAEFLMTPTSAAMPWPCDEPFPNTIAGAPAGPRAHAAFTGFVNLLGLPAISLPASSVAEGLPIGFQLIGRYGEEDALLDLAASYETAFGWTHEWPRVVQRDSTT